ncbi:Spc98 family-domain-containing protein [Dendryphion nanum]|uniref:Spindle pole body component n=1 Tax=Dendryphion nanum TaxID=256645 RepID=A0A9P9EDT8_9PLEO|nr:Spc98 family-domain-containing protein [Dendryphion nanum]
MAQNARVSALTDELIHSIVRFDLNTNRQAYHQARDIASKALKPHQYNRTNQFDVEASFLGLDEKFRVLNRDDLADALDSRFKELQGRRNKWIPEYLSLLLLLSDRPVDNSEVEALELLQPPEEPKPLTWKEILDEDPYSDEDIWKDIDYAEESSEDEKIVRRKVKKGQEISSPSSINEDDAFDPESCVVPVDKNFVDEIAGAQFWTRPIEDGTEKIEITELQAIRDTLFMLAGLQTSLYLSDKQNATIRVSQTYVFCHAVPRTMDNLLSQLAEIGRDLYRLRQWNQRESSLPLIQTFEAAVRRRITEYDRYLASLQRQYLVPESPIAVSLLELHNEIRTSSAPLLRLAKLVAYIEPSLLVNPFVHLETLFEHITLAQMTLEQEVYKYFSKIFFECLQTYLKPIRQWMTYGELGANDETFFVFENDSGSEASSLWHDRFVLRRGQGDSLRSPSFFYPAAQKIFNIGKSVVFLKELGMYNAIEVSVEPEPRLDHETVCGNADLWVFPFPELFQSAFETWIGSKYSLASTALRSHLLTHCGLLRTLKNLGVLFLGTDGSVFQDFADAVFERMSTKRRGWNDRYLLTELARGIYATVLDKSDSEKVVVRSVRTKSQISSLKGLATLSLDYALPWSIMNIIQRSSIPAYQQIFTFLLQTYRVKQVLQNIELSAIRRMKIASTAKKCFRLRHRLIWFADIIRSFLTETVIGQSTETMIAAVEKAEDIDEMSTIHVKYLAKIQEQALLADNLKPIYSTVISLLDLALSFSDAHNAEIEKQDIITIEVNKKSTKLTSKASRRKSIIPAIVEQQSSDSGEDVDQYDASPRNSHEGSSTSFSQTLDNIDREFLKLLPFLTAGLRTIGRVGADPVWEMLADRLEWDKKRNV